MSRTKSVEKYESLRDYPHVLSQRNTCHFWTWCESHLNGSSEEVRNKRCKNYHLLTSHWFSLTALCFATLWLAGELLLGLLCLVELATARGMLTDLLRVMHNALCVSWKGWTSDSEDWVSSRISNGLLSLPRPPLPFILFAGNSQHHWCGLFLCVAWEQRMCTSLACYCCLPLFLCLSSPLSQSVFTSLLSRGFNDSFTENVWPALSLRFLCTLQMIICEDLFSCIIVHAFGLLYCKHEPLSNRGHIMVQYSWCLFKPRILLNHQF